MSKTSTERSKEHDDRKRAEKLVPRRIWIDPSWIDYIKSRKKKWSKPKPG